MLHIKYRLEKSDTGMKLYTEEDLAAGTPVYSDSPDLDVDIPAEEFDKMDEKTQAEIRQWGFLLEPEDVWHVDFDISRYMAHSFEPNLVQDGQHNKMYLLAARDIKAGEELTYNFLEGKQTG